MNMYLHELKSNFKFITVWFFSILTLITILVATYSTVSADVDAFKTVLLNYPESIRTAFGIDIDRIGSALGYYSSFIITFVCVCSATEAMILGISILSKEVREKTADFIYTKPISRNLIVTNKILSSLTLLIISNIILAIVTFIELSLVANNTFDIKTFILLINVPYIIQLIFFTAGMFISSLMKKVKAILPISMGVVFFIYILSSFADEKMRALMPFKYFDTNYVLNNNSYEAGYLILSLCIIAFCTIFTYIFYKIKDIESV